MTGWFPDDVQEWAGRPVARRVADAAARRRAVLRGTVGRVTAQRGTGVTATRVPGGRTRGARGSSFDAVVDDGTGTIVVRWLGRDHVPGLQVGAEIEVEGTVSEIDGRLMILNPLYRFVAPVHARDPSVSDDPAQRASRGGSEGGGGPGQAGSSTSW